MWLGDLSREISGALGEKVKITEIKITSSEYDEFEPVWERQDRRSSHSYMSWDIYAPDLSAWRKSDETSKLHPMSSESRQQHPCRISIYTAAGVWRSCTERAGLWTTICLFFPLFFSQLQWMCSSGTGSTALWAANHSPRACKSLSHIWGWLPHCANSLGKIYMDLVLWHGLLSFPC